MDKREKYSYVPTSGSLAPSKAPNSKVGVENELNKTRLENSNAYLDGERSDKNLSIGSKRKIIQEHEESNYTNIDQSHVETNKNLRPDELTDSDYEKQADLEEAKKFRNENCIRRTDQAQYFYYNLWTTSLEDIGKYSIGVELYFWLIKTLTLAFFLISGVSVYSLYENSQGNGLTAGGVKQRWDILNIANINEVLEPGDLSDNKSMKTSLFIVDAVCSMLLLIFIIAYQIKCNSLISHHLANTINISDFAVKIKGIPEEITDPEIIKTHFSKYGSVYEVTLAKRYDGILSAYTKRSELLSQFSYNKILQMRGKNREKTLKKLEKEIQVLDSKINENETHSNKTHKELPTIRGYVIFDSVQSKNNCLLAYRKKVCCCNTQNDSPDLYLSNKHQITVLKAEPPSCIIFTNLEVTKWSKRFRRLFSLICIVLVFVLTMALVYSLSSYQKSLPQGPVCESIDSTQDIKYAEKYYTTTDQKYCWCKSQSYKSLLHGDQLNYCNDYLSKVSLNVTLRVLVSFSILILNIVIRYIVIVLSRFEKLSNINQERLKVMTRTFYGTFINTSIIILLVNANFSIIKTQSWLPTFLLNGEYTDFTRDWYTEVGSTITSTMLIQIFSPHWINLFILYPIGACKRKCGIRYCVTQTEANNRFSGQQFDLAIKNSFVLKVVFSCFLYSAGMPLLNVVCFLCLFGLYWIEKFLFFRHYAKPIQYNQVLNNEVIKMLPFCVIFHCAFGLYMFGSDSIFPLEYGKNNRIGDKIRDYVGFVYIIIMIIAASSYLWILGYGTCVNIFMKGKINNDREFRLSQDGVKFVKEGIDTYDICKMKEFKDVIEGLNLAAEKVKNKRSNNWGNK